MFCSELEKENFLLANRNQSFFQVGQNWYVDQCNHKLKTSFLNAPSQLRILVAFYEFSEDNQKIMDIDLNTFKQTDHGEGNGTPLQYSCLENPMDGGAWQAAVHGVAKSQTQLNDFTFPFHALEKEMATTLVFLPGESQGWGSLVDCPLWGRTESDTTEETQQQKHRLINLEEPKLKSMTIF